MAKRRATELRMAARAGGETAERHREREGPTVTITTAIHIPKTTWSLLRSVAFRRAQEGGGRASVSKLIAELVECRREELEAEIKK